MKGSDVRKKDMPGDRMGGSVTLAMSSEPKGRSSSTCGGAEVPSPAAEVRPRLDITAIRSRFHMWYMARLAVVSVNGVDVDTWWLIGIEERVK